MEGIVLFSLGLFSLAHCQELVPAPSRCQPPDTRCATSFNATGECVNMATVTPATLPDLYNLSAGAIDNICGPQTSSSLPSCCRCLSAATCSHPKCVPRGSRDRRCFQPARDVKHPGWFKVGVCNKNTNCDCLELCKSKKCDRAEGKCLLPEDPKPEGWSGAFMCNKQRKCSCFLPPCGQTDKCSSAGGQCLKKGSAPQGSRRVGNFCNSRCYCYKLPGMTAPPATTVPSPGTTAPPATTVSATGGCKCGLAVRNQRIVGGVETEINEYPWQVGMVSKGSRSVFCGATVISDRWILTAAHCTDGTSASQIQVLLGEHNYNTASETTSLRMDIVQIKNHESYNDRTTDYDFSLLKTTSAMDFSAYPNIRPACLPQAGSSETYTDWVATVTGWGTLVSGGSTSSKLREVDVKVVTNSACKSAYGSSITSRMLCAEAAGGNGGKDACQGDSGGPLVSKATGSDGVTSGQNYELIGVVSWGAGCADKDYPGVYARVTNQLSWIKTTAASDWQTCPRT